MIKILTHRSCIVSARLLKEALADIVDERILLTQNPARIRTSRFIRYGNSEDVRVEDTQFNSASFINLVANKARFAKIMSDNSIYSPVYHRNRPRNFPVLIRKTLTSSGGIGIVVCKDEATFNEHWDAGYVWTPFVSTQFELRVHVLGGKVVKIFKKLYIGEGQESALPIRNLDRGYHYNIRNLDKYPKTQSLIDKIDPLLGGRFYTLDLGYDHEKHDYFVFEANSGSGLNPETVQLYAQYLSDNL